MGREYRDKEWLKEKYVDDARPMSDVADLCDVSVSTIDKWIGKHDLPRRSRSESLRRAHGTHDGKYNDPDWLQEQYVEKERSAIDIAEECGVHNDTIYKRLDEHGIDRRTIKEATNTSDDMGFEGRDHPAWQEYVSLSTHRRDGYVNWIHRAFGDRHQIPVHRLLAVAEHGIDEVKDKHVHHKNGVKWDNRPENIEVLTHAEHMKIHHDRGDFPQSKDHSE